MKKTTKRLLSAALCIALAASVGGGLAACGGEEQHTHKWTWVSDTTGHYQICKDDNKKQNEGPHIDADNNGKCDVCDYPMEVIDDGEDKPVTGITLNKTTLTLEEGATETLVATVAPNDADNKAVTWASGNQSVATVSQTGLVTAVAAGTTTITVTSAADATKTATCTLTVTEAAQVEQPDTELIEGSLYVVGAFTEWQAQVGNRVDKGLKLHLTTNDSVKVVRYNGMGKDGDGNDIQLLDWFTNSTAAPGVLSLYANERDNAVVAEDGDYIVQGYQNGHFLIYKDGEEAPEVTCDLKGDWTGDWRTVYGMNVVTPTDNDVLYQFEYTLKVEKPGETNFGVMFYKTDDEDADTNNWSSEIADGSAVEEATLTDAGVYKFTVYVTEDGTTIKVEEAQDGDEDATAPWVDPNASVTTTLTVKLSETESFTLIITHPAPFVITGIHTWDAGAPTNWPGAPVVDGVVDLSGNTPPMNVIIVANNGSNQAVTKYVSFEAGATYNVTITVPEDGKTEYGIEFVKVDETEGE